MEGRLISSSSSFRNQCSYDVFLSFTGQDTRCTFTGHLYNALRQKGIPTFIDDEGLKRGEQISPALLKAIRQSRISIIIFSENYAFSSWCLDELVQILECRTKGQLVWPVFYNVNPSNVRHLKGSFGRAIAQHECRFKGDPEKVEKWRSALTEAANLSGWHFANGYEFKLIQEITKAASSALNHPPLYVAQHSVGLKSRISDLRSQLSMGSGDVRMIGIYGLGGVGKTTLAKALYNEIAYQFDGACFLPDVRESSSKGGFLQLYQAFVGEILGEEKVANVDKGISLIRGRLRSKKVLLIIDDVQNREDLEKLAGDLDWFGSGSIIIVTTRNKHLLVAHGIDILYEMKCLGHWEAIELFCWHAFRSSEPGPGYEDNARRAVSYADGLPLALKVIGCNLFGKGVGAWKCALDKYEKIPPNDIQTKLKISYDDLEENEKEIFLDLACFFKGEELEYVERLLDACGFYPKYGIGILTDRCLITIEDDVVKMHDLIQEMGREIVTQSLRSNPGVRSRLWFHDDILDVLTNNTGTHKIEAIMMNPRKKQEVQWSGDAFKKMPKLRMLVVRNASFSIGPTYLPNSLKVLEWTKYPSPSLPEDFRPRKLVVMCLPGNHLVFQEPFKGFESLTYMDFRKCKFLRDLPDMSSVSSLTTLLLNDCKNLVQIHGSVGFLSKLVTFSACGCSSLESFPHEIRLMSLQYLNLWGCCKLHCFPDVLEKMENTLLIDLSFTAIEDLPSSMGNLSALQVLNLIRTKNLRNLPTSIGMGTNLLSICLQYCPQVVHYLKSNHDFGKLRYYFLKRLELSCCDLSDEEIPTVVNCFPSIEYLNLEFNNFVKVSACIKELYHLKVLCLDYCKLLEEIEGAPPNLEILCTRGCNRLRLTSELANIKQVSSGDRPECFNHYLGEGKMYFWFRKNFPDLPLCLAFSMEPDTLLHFFEIICDIRIHVNSVPFRTAGLVVSVSKGRHFEFIHLHSFIEDRYVSEEFENFEWNHVEILFELREPYEVDISLRTWPSPVLVYGKKPDTEDILLRDPVPVTDTLTLCGSEYGWSGALSSSSTIVFHNSIPDEQCSVSGQGNGTIITWNQPEMEAEKTSQRDQLVSNDFSLCALIYSVVTLCCPSSLNSP